jgi:hypothetical protein
LTSVRVNPPFTFLPDRAACSATGRGRDGAGDETVQFAQIERLVQIAECPLDQRVGLLPALVVSAHHEDRRIHAEVADALEQVETLSPEQGVPYSRHDHVQQNEVKALTLQDVERIGDRMRRRDLISVPVLKAGDDIPQHVEHVWLVIDDQDSLRGLRVDRRLPLGPRGSKASRRQLGLEVAPRALKTQPRRQRATRACYTIPRESLKLQHPPAEPDDPEEPTANRRHRVSLGPAPATQPEVRALDEAIQSR